MYSTRGSKARRKMPFTAFAALAVSASATANAGPIADELGIYLREPPGQCAEDELEYRNACIPSETVFAYDSEYVMLGYWELVHPESSKALQRDYVRRSSTRAEAYAVEVDRFGADIFKLVDGSVLEKVSSGYVGLSVVRYLRLQAA